MPVYNTAPYLREAIGSILNQTYRNFEFLIFNDGSTDESLSIIQSFSDERIKLTNSEENKGLIYWLNFGINMARGELIARMDSDDIALPHRFAEQISVFKNNPNVAICGSNIQILNKNGLGDKMLYPEFDDNIKIEMLFNCAVAHPAVMYKKAIFESVGDAYDESFLAAEDYHLWYRLKNKATFYNIQKVLLHYRVFDRQVSSRYKDIQTANSKKVRQLLLTGLGITSDLGNYEDVLNGAWKQSRQYLVSVGDWMEQLCTANDVSGRYDKLRFKKNMAEKFWARCYFAAVKGCDGLGIYKQYQFSAYYHPPLFQKVKAFFKARLLS